ncbi:MAG: aspartate carbamoyltransferase catalytic subunit [Planctomycetota bacterium]
MIPGLLELETITSKELEAIFHEADGFFEAAEGKVERKDLAGRTIANLFFEDSTRTANSFYLAGRRLGATVLDFTGAGSSLSKGETLLDTAKNICAMGVDLFVVRHVSPGAPHMIAQALGKPVVNAGDGSHEHPTQGLLDAYTLYREVGSVKKLKELTVAIVGDILHSRVARSNIHALKALGCRVILVGPPALLPPHFAGLGCEIRHSLDEVLSEVDVLNFLRLQNERMQSGLVASLREYKYLYGMTAERLKKCRKNVFIMHPGPMNRGVEIDPEVADGPRSLIFKQVTCGMAVRMAVLTRLIGKAPSQTSKSSRKARE